MSNNVPVKAILILAANPTNTAPLGVDQEIREIDEGLRRANKRICRSRTIQRNLVDIELPKNYQEGVDAIKVFPTVNGRNFQLLELPALDQS